MQIPREATGPQLSRVPRKPIFPLPDAPIRYPMPEREEQEQDTREARPAPADPAPAAPAAPAAP